MKFPAMKFNGSPWFDLFMLSIEAQQVIMLRLTHFATGAPGACAEASRMITEKIEALADGQHMMTLALMRGDPEAGVERLVVMYRNRVRANRARLAKM